MTHAKTKAKVVVSKDGPYLVTGDVPLSEQIIGTDENGGSERWEQGVTYKEQTTYIVPLRTVEDEAVLRRHTCEGRLRRHGNGQQSGPFANRPRCWMVLRPWH